MPVMHPTVTNAHAKLHKEFNKSFKLQYYKPVCCLLLYLDCAHKANFIDNLQGVCILDKRFCLVSLSSWCGQCIFSYKQSSRLQNDANYGKSA